jgi:hypothetical protein
MGGMSEPPTLPRPRQVAVAGGVAVAACALLVVALFDSMAQVRSVEMRSTITDILGKTSGDRVDQLVRLLRLLVLLDGALAAAGAVFAVFALQRHNGARIGLTVAAGLLLVTAPLSGVVFPVLLATSATMLWSRPARDWFAGRAPAPVAAPAQSGSRRREASRQAGLSSSSEPERPSDEGERPGPSPYPFGSQPGAQGYPVPASSPHGPSYPGPVRPGGRPASVTAAAWITWIFGGLTIAAYALVMAILVFARDLFLEALRRDPQVAKFNLSTDQIMAALWLFGVVVIFWSLAAMVLAFFAYRRMTWARVTLVVSAVIAALFSLVAFPVGLLHTAASVATAWLLLRGDVGRWYAGREQGPTYGPVPPAGPAPAPRPEKPPKNVW